MAEQLMSPEDLANELLNDRFDGDEIATTKYLLNAIDALPNAEETKRKLAGGLLAGAVVDSSAVDCDIGDIVVERVSVSCTQPRGKLDMTVGSTGILFAKDGVSLFAVQGSVSHCIFFPKPSECRKRWKTGAKLPPDMVMLYIEESITYKKKSYSQICFQLPDNATETWIERLESVLQINTTERVYLRENKVFRSYQDEKTSSTSAGLPFVECYHNVADGSLFFLKSGVFFFGSGMRFLPRGGMDAIQAVAGNRYVTLSVTLESDDDDHDGDGGVLEFTNIHKVENDGIQRYIHKTLIPAMQKDADGEDHGGDTKEDDEDIESGGDAEQESDEEDGDNKSSRRKRKAANEALAINKRAFTSRNGEDEDDDDDEEEDADQNYEAGGGDGEEGDDTEDEDDDEEEDYEDE